MTPKAQATKPKNRHVGLQQTKKLCTAKGTINRVKRQPMKWEKIFVNHTSDKELISKIYKELKQLCSKETNNLIKNGQRIRIKISQEKT